jgi:hypothetical protein
MWKAALSAMSKGSIVRDEAGRESIPPSKTVVIATGNVTRSEMTTISAMINSARRGI